MRKKQGVQFEEETFETKHPFWSGFFNGFVDNLPKILFSYMENKANNRKLRSSADAHMTIAHEVQDKKKTGNELLDSHESELTNANTTVRNSPREHIVSSHWQHYGKDKKMKEVRSYTRGGKSDKL